MKYAIFKQGSKQYKAKKGDVLDIDLLDAEEGANVDFEVLFLGDATSPVVGAPTIKGSKVTCKVIGRVAGPKLKFVKYQPNHTQRRTYGARQKYTRVEVVEIS